MTLALPWPHPVLLAPLTKGGTLPYRRLCVDFGAKVTCSEMAYAHHLLRGSGRELALLRHHESESFFGVQLAAREAQLAADATKLAEDHGAKWVDLNCGCPIDDTVKRGMGARLLERTRTLEDIVRAMVAATDLPVSVKIRIGFRKGKENASVVARMIEDCGAAAVILHGRSREQRYSKAAKWDAVGDLVKERSIPVIGNGDILTWYEAEDRLAQSGAAGLMLARGALTKPWLFQEIEEGRELCLDSEQRVGVYHRLATYYRDYFGADALGRKRSVYFLAFHFSFFSRYMPLPEAEWRPLSKEHPLLQTRDAKPRPEGGLDRLLASGDKGVHDRIAGELWDAEDAQDAVQRLHTLAAACTEDGSLERLSGRPQTGGWG
ncbi:MAG: tRNA-dihydrouridine synthase family protein [Myxococcota bacterium]